MEIVLSAFIGALSAITVALINQKKRYKEKRRSCNSIS